MGVLGGHLGPAEPGEFSGDGDRDELGGVLSVGEATELGAEAQLGVPGPGQGVGGDAGLAAGEGEPDGGLVAIRPGGLDEVGAQVGVAGAGDVAAGVWVPLEYSLGTRPQKPMKVPARGKRRQSATSAAMLSAPKLVMPR